MSNQNAESQEVRKQYDIPHEIPLSFPVTWGEETKKSIKVTRRLKAGDYKGIKSGEIKFDDLMKLGSKITGESRSFIEELDSEDFFTLVEVINSFLPNSPETGENG